MDQQRMKMLSWSFSMWQCPISHHWKAHRPGEDPASELLALSKLIHVRKATRFSSFDSLAWLSWQNGKSTCRYPMMYITLCNEVRFDSVECVKFSCIPQSNQLNTPPCPQRQHKTHCNVNENIMVHICLQALQKKAVLLVHSLHELRQRMVKTNLQIEAFAPKPFSLVCYSITARPAWQDRFYDHTGWTSMIK